MAITSRLKLRYPVLADSTDVPRDIQNLANDIDIAAIIGQGPLASRPVSSPGTPGIQGRFYVQTDGGGANPYQLWLDFGTGWVNLGPTTAAGIADGSITTPKLANGAVTDVKVAALAIATANLQDASVTLAKLANALKPSTGAGASAEALRALGTTAGTAAAGDDPRFAAIGSGAPAGPAGGALSGTYPNPGLAATIVATGNLIDAAVTTAKLLDAAVTTAKINDGAVTGAKLAAAAVAAANIVAGAVGTAQIAGSAITTALIAAGAVDGTKIAAGAVDASKIAASLKPSGGAAAGTEALRALGTTAGTAAAGDDPRFGSGGGGSGGPALIDGGSSLPGSPADDTVYAYRVVGSPGADGYWLMRYDATLGYWTCIGGTPWMAVRDDLDTITSSTWAQSPVDLHLAAPFSGTYRIRFGAIIGNYSANGRVRIGVSINNVNPREENGGVTTPPWHYAEISSDAGVQATVESEVAIASVVAGQEIRFMMRCIVNGQSNIVGRKFISIILARTS